MNTRRQTLAASQSRNPRFHSDSVLKLGRVSVHPAEREEHPGWDHFLPEQAVRKEAAPRSGKPLFITCLKK
jgi:hypothetical protein